MVMEIFASKTVALLTRTAPRDLYDMYNMVKYGLHDESEEAMLRKCTARRKSVENVMAIMLSATNGPDELFLKVLDSYILGEIMLEEMEDRIDRFEYLGNEFRG